MWPFRTPPPEMQPADPLLQLLDDAQLLTLYCIKTGTLRDNDLPTAVARFEAAPDKSWKSEETVALLSAVNNTVLSIAPVNLHDLRNRPPAVMLDGNAGLGDAPTLIVVLLTAAIMVFTAMVTLGYNRTTTLIAEMAQFQTENVRSEMTSTVYTIVQNLERIGGTTEEGEQQATLQAIHNDIHSIKAIDDRVETVFNEFQALVANFNAIQHYSLPLVTPTVAQDDAYAGASQPNPCLRANDAAKLVNAAQTAQNAVDSNPAVPPIIRTLILDIFDSLYVTCAANLRFHLVDFPNFDALENQLQVSANMFGLWILPALYGGLGAALFHMRLVLSPRLPSPSWPRILHRLAIGAFAGVILGWFWAPSGSTSEFTNIGLNVFGVAFLVGYSIDVFFSLLDRLIALLSTGISQINASATPTK
ncbi:hypothetical protein SAMN05428969_1331 [Devosia sp. YR412]|uniref:hypothetical protein n=1 Tax=Devosia sp. YR412 TaxID=1881030 RepID=UPI0008C10588|nr:hypothetical protein [Devosia sp. YR412]SEP96774.1 hypothetical protein SAMN05428969_1331 [Devosia sp. YR412]